ncbi:MAG: Na+/H+ antiporter subunit D, partial [Cellulomonas sp.]
LPFGMVAPTAALVVVGLLLTVAAGPLYAYTERAAVALTEQTPYVDAVLPDGERGQGVSDDVAETHP